MVSLHARDGMHFLEFCNAFVNIKLHILFEFVCLQTGYVSATAGNDGAFQEWLDYKLNVSGVSAEYVDNLADFDAVDPNTTDYLMGNMLT